MHLRKLDKGFIFIGIDYDEVWQRGGERELFCITFVRNEGGRMLIAYVTNLSDYVAIILGSLISSNKIISYNQTDFSELYNLICIEALTCNKKRNALY